MMLGRGIRSSIAAGICLAGCVAPSKVAGHGDLWELPVAVIEVSGCTGTAFCVGPGIWVTCRHIFREEPTSCTVYGRTRAVRRFSWGEGDAGDWCVLALDPAPLAPFMSTLKYAGSPQRNETVWCVGFPRGDATRGPYVLQATVGAPLPDFGMVRVDNPNEVTQGGMSGGPVVRRTEAGALEVVGLVSAHVDYERRILGLFTLPGQTSAIAVDPALGETLRSWLGEIE
jgi:hypothetical protein